MKKPLIQNGIIKYGTISALLELLVSIPSELSTTAFYGLILLSCGTSLISASMGIGGGTVLLAVMAQVIPIKALIPVHGVVQLGSNFGRAMMLMSQLNWQLTAWFLAGSLAGALLGGQIVVSLPVITLKVTLGVFILYSVWGPKLSGLSSNTRGLLGGGFLSTLLTMFVGATGPFVIAILRSFELSRSTLVATSAACMVFQHLLKIIVFGLLGFAFSPYTSLVALMMISGLFGTFIGTKLLVKVDEKKFQQGLNIVLSLLALRLIIVPFLNY